MVESDSIRLGKTGRTVIFQPSVGGARSGKMLDCYGLNTLRQFVECPLLRYAEGG